MKRPQLPTGLRFLFVLALLAVAPAHAASFDCGKAVSPIEKLICSDQTLSALDERMAEAYKAALVVGDPLPADIAKTQKSWLSWRSRCISPQTSDADNIGCLTYQYRQRVEFLAHPQICRIDRLGDCHDTNQLIWNGGAAAFRAFLGPDKKADATIGLLGGPPEDIQDLPNGWKLAAACRAHDCSSKGAAILTTGGEVVAMAALTYRCEDIKCVGDYGLRIYLGNEADHALARQTFETWAEAVLSREYVMPGTPGNHLSETNVELVQR